MAKYKYDAMGRRVRKIVTNSGTLNGATHFISQGSMDIEEFAITNPGANETLALSARYVNGLGMDNRLIVERQDAGNVSGNGNTSAFQRFYYHTDVLGSVRAITWLDPSTNTEKLVERVDYDIYGKATFTNWGPTRDWGTPTASATSLVGNQYLFTGRYLDAESGNYFYRARYYSPNTGRFMSQDPLAYVNGPNMYQYCGSSPLNYMDPMGRDLSDWIWGAVEGLAAGACVAVIVTGVAIASPAAATAICIVGVVATVDQVTKYSTNAYDGNLTVSQADRMSGQIIGGTVGSIGTGKALQVHLNPVVPEPPSAAPAKPCPSGGDNNVTIYRGVNETNLHYQEALGGTQTPIGGHSDPELHNAGDTRSVFTSWTTDKDIAIGRAEGLYPDRSTGNGVLLEITVPESRLTPSPDKVMENEVLIEGPISGAKVTPVGNKAQ